MQDFMLTAAQYLSPVLRWIRLCPKNQHVGMSQHTPRIFVRCTTNHDTADTTSFRILVVQNAPGMLTCLYAAVQAELEVREITKQGVHPLISADPKEQSIQCKDGTMIDDELIKCCIL